MVATVASSASLARTAPIPPTGFGEEVAPADPGMPVDIVDRHGHAVIDSRIVDERRYLG